MAVPCVANKCLNGPFAERSCDGPPGYEIVKTEGNERLLLYKFLQTPWGFKFEDLERSFSVYVGVF